MGIPLSLIGNLQQAVQLLGRLRFFFAKAAFRTGSRTCHSASLKLLE
jgi:hypothetical protein